MDSNEISFSSQVFNSNNFHHHDHPHPRHFIYGNKKLLYDIKIAIVVTIGAIIVLGCIIYIVLQCRRKPRVSFVLPRHRDSFSGQQNLMDNIETTETLLNGDPGIKEKDDERYREFYVWSNETILNGVIYSDCVYAINHWTVRMSGELCSESHQSSQLLIISEYILTLGVMFLISIYDADAM